MRLKGFRPDPYEEDLKFSELRYCFGGDGGGGGGGGDDGSSGDDYGSDGFAGDTDASVGGGYASEGGNGESMSESGGPPSTADDPGTSTSGVTGPMGDSGDYSVGVDLSDDVTDAESYTNNSYGAYGEGGTGLSESFTESTDFNPDDWANDPEALDWADSTGLYGTSYGYGTTDMDFDMIEYQMSLVDIDKPTEMDAETAYDYAQTMGQQFNAPEGFSVDAYGVAAQPGMFESIGQSIGEFFGVLDPQTYVADPSRGFGDKVGQVTSEYGIADAIASAMIPFASIDTKTATFPSGQTQGYGEANFGLGFGISVGTGLTATSSGEVGVTSGGTGIGGEDSGGDEGDEYTQSGEGYTQEYEKSVASAGAAPQQRSALLPYFLQQKTPNYVYYNQSSNPYAYYREGGQVQQMDEILANPVPQVNIAEVQKNPDAYLRNPEGAGTAEELEEIYKYNEYILDVSRQPIQAQEGMQVGQPAPEGGDGPMGFVEQKPENVPDAATVADDKPVDVEEGTFVINAAAVEFAGSEDIKAMILNALAEAEKQGLDISGDGNKINKERQVSLLVSRGEVLIPPALAKIIGYDKLNKINNRGKEETEKRIAENGQAPEQPQNPAEGMTAAGGGIQTNIADTEVIDVYRSIVAQGGEPGRFQVFEKAFQEYQKGKAYRPMQSEIGTPEFDEEVRRKYGYAFPETEGGIFATKHRDAPLVKTKKKVSKPDSGEGFVPAP